MIIPSLNDEAVPRMVRDYQAWSSDIQLIIVEGGDPKEALAKISPELRQSYADFQHLSLPQSNRAQRLNRGIEEAKHPFILLKHPRSILSSQAISHALQLSEEETPLWGGFEHCFDSRSLFLRLTSAYSNQIRGRLRGIYYLDHCIFFHRDLLTQPIPPFDVFEDTELCLLLLQEARPKPLKGISVTSAVRYRTHGLWNQFLRNQLVKIAYFAGASHERINQFYERGLFLNILSPRSSPSSDQRVPPASKKN